MSDQLMEIAERLRELRQICDFSLEEMAGAVGVPVEEYAKYESGQKDLPISVVLEVAQKCKVEPSILLTGEEPKLHEFCRPRARRNAPGAQRPRGAGVRLRAQGQPADAGQRQGDHAE